MRMRINVATLLALLVGCTAAAPWRATPPTLPAMASLSKRVPDVDSLEATGGLAVLVADRPHSPLISVQLVFRAGSADDPRDKDGLASLAYGLLAEHATRTMSAKCSESSFGLHGAPVLSVEADGARIGASVIPEDLERLVEALAGALETMHVTAADLARVKRSGASVTEGRTSSPFIPQATVARVVLGDLDALARSPSGTAATRSRVTAEDIEAFLEAQARPGELALVVAGAAPPPEDLLEMIDRHFSRWAVAHADSVHEPLDGESGAPAALRPEIEQPGRGSAILSALRIGTSRRGRKPMPVVKVPSAGAPRLVVALGSPAQPSDPAGEAALRMAEQALGGALRWHLRERSQLAYRVTHELTLHRAGGLLAASATMSRDAVSQATAAAHEALGDASDWLRLDPGFSAARQAALQALLAEMETACGLGAATARLHQRGLPPTHYRDVAVAIERAPVGLAREAMERLLDPTVARILLIGTG